MWFTSSMFNTRGLVKLGIFSREKLDLSSWWCSFSGKIAVSRRMELVEEMDTY